MIVIGGPWLGGQVLISHLGAIERDNELRHQEPRQPAGGARKVVAGKACTSKKEFLEEISLHFYFRPEVFESMLERWIF